MSDKQKATERAILNNLKRRGDMMTTGTLWAETKLDEPKTSYSEFKDALQELEIKGQVIVVTGEDRDKAKITQKGIARLME